ncbi:MAG: hypothetical protein U1F00_07525 [Rhodoferax sp.]
MSGINEPESATQDRVIELISQELGCQYLGDLSEREGNHCIEEGLLTAHLAGQGYSPAHISAALHRLRTEAPLHGRTLYAANQAVYQLLRYGVSVKVGAGEVSEVPGYGPPSLHRHALRQIPRLVHVRPPRAGRVVGQQLQRHHMQQG